MKQFNLKEYLKNPNRKVVTRDGKSVRILCTDRIGGDYSVIGLCRISDNIEKLIEYLPDGSYFSSRAESGFDLFFAPEKLEGWINIYEGNGIYYIGKLAPYSSEREAIRNITKELGYVATIKIEWE